MGPKKFFSVFTGVFLILGVCGCGFERPLQSEATYQAPKTGYEIMIRATGVVPAGADIVDVPSGSVEIRPFANLKGKKRITLMVKNEKHVIYHYDDGNPSAMEWDFRTRNAVYADLLIRAGYERPDADEVKESLEVMYGVMYGPKSTRLKGQTKFLQVIEVKLSAV